MGDPAKHIDRAERFLARRRPELAMAEYRLALDEAPCSEELLERAIDLNLSQGNSQYAAELLQRVFALYVQAPNLEKASVALRKLIGLRSIEPETVVRYAELAANTNRKEGADAYRFAHQEFLRRSENAKALDAISCALKIEPRIEDYREQARLAELLSNGELASIAHVQVGVLLEAVGQSPAEAYERALAADPSSMAARLGWGRALLAQGRAAEAIEMLRPLATYPSSPLEAREPYTLALLALGRIEEVEPLIWRLYEANPAERLGAVYTVIGGLLDRGQTERALTMTRRLEDHQRKVGRRQQFIHDIKDFADARPPMPEFLEYLAELYNSSNSDEELAATLLRLFDVYFRAGNFAKALDSLERLADLDPTATAVSDRVLLLSGKVDDSRLQRLSGAPKREEVEVKASEAPSEAEVPKQADELIVQAELFLQYGMREKALDQLEQISREFPDRMNDAAVHRLVQRLGLAAPKLSAEPAPAEEESEAEQKSVVVFIPGLRAAISQQGDARSVLSTVIRLAARQLECSRCVAVIGAPERAPVMVLEYCASGVAKSERVPMVKLLATCQQLAMFRPEFHTSDTHLAPELANVQREIQQLSVDAMMSFAIHNDRKILGLLIIEQCDAERRWSAEDVSLLRAVVAETAERLGRVPMSQTAAGAGGS